MLAIDAAQQDAIPCAMLLVMVPIDTDCDETAMMLLSLRMYRSSNSLLLQLIETATSLAKLAALSSRD
jgi:hypothetical protein